MTNIRRPFTILLPLLAVLLAPTGAWEASVSQNLSIRVTPATQSVSFAPTTLTFASQNIGTSSAAQTVTMTNSGSVPFPLSSVATTGTNAGDFAESNNCPSSLAVSANCQISVIFTPTLTGTETASVVVSATGGGTYTVPLSGTGTSTSIVAAFYVATNGSDSNAGTLASPFATLTRCQTAMRNSSTIKTCYIRSGTYPLSSSTDNCGLGGSGNGAATEYLVFNSSDAGESWSNYPPDGYNNAILDGGAAATTPGSGLGAFFCLGGGISSGISITGLQMQHFRLWSVWANSPVTLTNNVIHDGSYLVSEAGTEGSGTNLNTGSGGSVVSHNYIYNLAGPGILQETGSTSVGGTISNTTISYNFIQNTCSNLGDCGCIYEGEQSTTGTSSTNIQIINNYCRDVFTIGNGQWLNTGQSTGGIIGTGNWSGSAHGFSEDAAGMCIYLDNSGSNVTVTGNVCTGVYSSAVQVHGGGNNKIHNNIFDDGAAANTMMDYYQTCGGCGFVGGSFNMADNSFINNIIIERNQAIGGGSVYNGSGGPPNPSLVTNNQYWNFSSSNIFTSCQGGACGSGGTSTTNDNNPVTGNPLIHCWGAILAAASPAFNALVSFRSQPSDYDTPGYWGPPGFTVTHTGTPPSWTTTSGDGVTCTSSN
jgi:hypothetical protein